MGEFLVFKFGNHDIMSSSRGSWLETANLTDWDKALGLSDDKNSYSIFTLLVKVVAFDPGYAMEQIWQALFDTGMNIWF